MKTLKIRSILYGTAKILGDISAVQSGSSKKIYNRAKNRFLGNFFSRFFGK